MESNTHSTGRRRGRLAALTAEIDAFLAQDLDRLTDAALGEEILELRPQIDRLEGGWLQHLAAVDARGAAGAEQDRQFGSTAGWLRARLRMASGAATTAVRTARALFRGPLPNTAAAVMNGEVSVAHAEVLAASTLHAPDHVVADAEPTLLDAARRLDPTGLRQVVTHFASTIDPDRADQQAQRRYERRGMWLTVTLDRMVAVRGIMAPEAGQTLITALEPLARPADAADTRSGGQRTADALTELARRQLEGGQLPKTGGVRPPLSVIVDLPSLNRLDGPPSRLGGEVGRLGGRSARPAPWTRRPVGGWPVTRPSPGWWSAASPWRPVPTATATTPRIPRPPAWRDACGRCWPSSPRSWAAPPPDPWTSAGPPGS